jgi:diadenosine tetraphosphate (Ap4A) HIT family hydrolase
MSLKAMSNCFACKRIDRIHKGENPYFVAELSESYVVLADDQRYEGYCILALKDHHEHLSELPVKQQLGLFEDVIRTAKVIKSLFRPVRLNYECLGNTLHHVHWHVIPRYDWDPDLKRPIWIRPEEERRIGVDPEKLRELRELVSKAFTEST